MDSLTQLAVGAAAGEAVLGRKLGNRAVLWGAVVGTLPDLDIIPGWFFDTPDKLLFHRGFTHSLAFILLATLLFSWIFSHFFKRKNISFKEWNIYFGLIFTLSILIDAFTSYGTQLLWPFKYRFEFNTIFVADPLFTLPLLITLVWLLFKPKQSAIRRKLISVGLGLSSLYLLFTVVNKQIINHVFKQELDNENVVYTRFFTNPTPLNQLLWYTVVEKDDQYLIGYYSHFDENKDIEFEALPKNHQLLLPFINNEEVKKILRFTKGYYTVEKSGDNFLINDLRFGRITNWRTAESQYVFQYVLTIKKGKITIEESEKSFENTSEVFEQLWQRINGKKDFS